MKDLYLLILKEYKKEIVIGLLILTIIGVGIQYQMNVLTLSSVLTIFVSFFFCLYAWLNGTFTFAFPIDQRSSEGEIIRRWLMIVIGFMVHLFAIFEPVYQ
ncbi:hypothetical protein [Acinetobacter haemolyticus]|uniref:hypothetical protein n=1 Tax=Acinetobacter haemolyticus TaxID=29430 RepID=UPI0030081E76